MFENAFQKGLYNLNRALKAITEYMPSLYHVLLSLKSLTLILHTRKSLTKIMCTCYYADVRADLRTSINTNFVLKYIYFTEKMGEINYPILVV